MTSLPPPRQQPAHQTPASGVSYSAGIDVHRRDCSSPGLLHVKGIVDESPPSPERACTPHLFLVWNSPTSCLLLVHTKKKSREIRVCQVQQLFAAAWYIRVFSTSLYPLGSAILSLSRLNHTRSANAGQLLKKQTQDRQKPTRLDLSLATNHRLFSSRSPIS